MQCDKILYARLINRQVPRYARRTIRERTRLSQLVPMIHLSERPTPRIDSSPHLMHFPSFRSLFCMERRRGLFVSGGLIWNIDKCHILLDFYERVLSQHLSIVENISVIDSTYQPSVSLHYFTSHQSLWPLLRSPPSKRPSSMTSRGRFRPRSWKSMYQSPALVRF